MPRLTLVKAKSFFFPKEEHDYQVLFDLGTPMVKIDNDALVLLKALCERRKVTIEYENLRDQELAMLEKLGAKWDYEIEVEGEDLIFIFPREKGLEQTFASLERALVAWYKKRYITLSTEIKVKRTTYRATLTRTFAI